MKITRVAILLIVGILLTTLSPLVVTNVEAAPAIIYVPDDYSTIQAAVVGASPGDTIIVRDDIYTENVDVNKSLTIQSENGAALATVQASNTDDDVFRVTADFVNITGFTATGATGVGYHGIHLEGVAYCNLTNNIVSNNWGGILLDESNDSDIANNNVNSNANGGGIVLEYSWDNSITNNTANLNGNYGIYLYHSDSNEVTENAAPDNGSYSIMLFDAEDNDVISNNASDSNTGIGLYFLINCNLRNNNVSNNTYGILLSGVTDSEIVNNDALGNTYGIEVYNSDNNDIYLNNFANNTDNYFVSGSTNTWNSSEEIIYSYDGNNYTNYLGNYWDDYSGSDADGNGIGDTPYIIQWDSDIYPLVEHFENYETWPYIPELTPHFVADINDMAMGDVVTFENLTTGGAHPYTKADWDFDADGAIDLTLTGTEAQVMADVTHSYEPGVYTVRLWMTDSTPTIRYEERPSYITVSGY